MLKKDLIARLMEMETGKIKVIWNTGGDETIINFFEGKKNNKLF